jgi:hypothetical protein
VETDMKYEIVMRKSDKHEGKIWNPS